MAPARSKGDEGSAQPRRKHCKTHVGFGSESVRLWLSIEHGPFDADVKWALYNVLARLTLDGRMARQRTLEFLAASSATV